MVRLKTALASRSGPTGWNIEPVLNQIEEHAESDELHARSFEILRALAEAIVDQRASAALESIPEWVEAGPPQGEDSRQI